MIGKVAVCEIQNLIIAYKSVWTKQLYPEPSTIFFWWMSTTARKLRIDTDVRRVVYGRDEAERHQRTGDSKEPLCFKTERFHHQSMRRALSL